MVTNAGADYTEEVVIATNTGLLWMHVQEVADGGAFSTMPTGYEIQRSVAGATQTSVQPHTNMSLGASYAISTEPQDGFLHVLDTRGNYWRVDAAGNTSLYDRENIEGVRGWSYVGAGPSIGTLAPPHVFLDGPASPPAEIRYGVDIRTQPWVPIDTSVVVFEKSGAAYKGNNWRERFVSTRFFRGFALFEQGGCAVARGADTQIWEWTGDNGVPEGPWWNMVEGLRLDSSAVVAGVWASTADQPASVAGGLGDLCDYHVLRTQVANSEAFDVQSVQAVVLQAGQFAGATAVVLGCPGGRVRVLMPGAMRIDDVSGHELGSVESSPDFGYGGSALAVRHEVDAGGDDVVRIWFGTVGDNLGRPSVYANASASLQDHEVSAGQLHVMEWRPGGSGFSNASSIDLHPNPSAPRGAYGVVGIAVADLLPASPGDELVVATMSGDIIVYEANSMTELWRDHVVGSVGMYNAIVIDDLDNDAVNELYVAGSFGVWRFFP